MKLLRHKGFDEYRVGRYSIHLFSGYLWRPTIAIREIEKIVYEDESFTPIHKIDGYILVLPSLSIRYQV